MRMETNKEASQVLILANALKDQPPKGVTLLRLSAETGIAVDKARALLSKHTDYFVQVGGQRVYALNRFGWSKGDISKIRNDIEREKQQSHSLFILAIVRVVQR